MTLQNHSVIFLIAVAATADNITFPRENHVWEGCGPFQNCINIKKCFTARKNIDIYKTCKFEQLDEFVCCDLYSFLLDKESPATKACDKVYPRVDFFLNGIPAEENEFPYMVSLGWLSSTKNTYDFKCGGVLISDNFILTAAHCAYVNVSKPAVAVIGGVNLRTANMTYNISEVFVHPEYKPQLAYHDLALLKLHRPISGLKSACLWNWYSFEADELTVVGYGHTKFGGPSSDDLLKSPMLSVPNYECEKSYDKTDFLPEGIHNKQLCIKDPHNKRDTCQGDSGGPVLMRIHVYQPLRPYVVGITSFGQSCGGTIPGVYTRISEYVDWIESIVWPQNIPNNMKFIFN